MPAPWVDSSASSTDLSAFQCRFLSFPSQTIWATIQNHLGHYTELQPFDWLLHISGAQIALLYSFMPDSMGSHCMPILQILTCLYMLHQICFSNKHGYKTNQILICSKYPFNWAILSPWIVEKYSTVLRYIKIYLTSYRFIQTNFILLW